MSHREEFEKALNKLWNAVESSVSPDGCVIDDAANGRAKAHYATALALYDEASRLSVSPPTAAPDTEEAPRPSYITVTVPRPKALPTVTDADVLRALDVWHSQTTKNGTKNTATPARLRRVLEDFASRQGAPSNG